MHLDHNLEKFYTGMLSYAGMELQNNIVVNKNDKLGDVSIDDKHLTLPYFENLKDPQGRIIFHPLNENYTSPENTVFNLYKRRLILELNMRVSSLIVTLVSIASDVQLQQKVKSSALIKLIGDLGEIDLSLVEHFMGLIKASRKHHDAGFIFDIFLKKNGEINDVPYAAIGKINFHLYHEVMKSLEDKDREYKVYGHKLRKKDLLALETLFNVIFPSLDKKDAYAEGTDNKVFRYLNVLLKTSYLISHRVNEIADMLKGMKEPSLNIEDIEFDLGWTEYLEKVQGMATEIRLIPNQLDLSVEASKLKLDETKAAHVQPQQTQQVAAPQAAPSAPVFQPHVQQVQQPMQPPSPEDIIRGTMAYPGQMPVMQPMMQPGMMQPGMMQQPAMPMWMQQEMMRTGQMPQQPGTMMQQPMQPMMQPGMMMQQPMQPMMQPGMMQPGMMMQQPMMQPMGFQPPQMQQAGLQLNPHFAGRQPAPWN